MPWSSKKWISQTHRSGLRRRYRLIVTVVLIPLAIGVALLALGSGSAGAFESVASLQGGIREIVAGNVTSAVGTKTMVWFQRADGSVSGFEIESLEVSSENPEVRPLRPGGQGVVVGSLRTITTTAGDIHLVVRKTDNTVAIFQDNGNEIVASEPIAGLAYIEVHGLEIWCFSNAGRRVDVLSLSESGGKLVLVLNERLGPLLIDPQTPPEHEACKGSKSPACPELQFVTSRLVDAHVVTAYSDRVVLFGPVSQPDAKTRIKTRKALGVPETYEIRNLVAGDKVVAIHLAYWGVPRPLPLGPVHVLRDFEIEQGSGVSVVPGRVATLIPYRPRLDNDRDAIPFIVGHEEGHTELPSGHIISLASKEDGGVSGVSGTPNVLHLNGNELLVGSTEGLLSTSLGRIGTASGDVLRPVRQATKVGSVSGIEQFQGKIFVWSDRGIFQYLHDLKMKVSLNSIQVMGIHLLLTDPTATFDFDYEYTDYPDDIDLTLIVDRPFDLCLPLWPPPKGGSSFDQRDLEVSGHGFLKYAVLGYWAKDRFGNKTQRYEKKFLFLGPYLVQFVRLFLLILGVIALFAVPVLLGRRWLKVGTQLIAMGESVLNFSFFRLALLVPWYRRAVFGYFLGSIPEPKDNESDFAVEVCSRFHQRDPHGATESVQFFSCRVGAVDDIAGWLIYSYELQPNELPIYPNAVDGHETYGPTFVDLVKLLAADAKEQIERYGSLSESAAGAVFDAADCTAFVRLRAQPTSSERRALRERLMATKYFEKVFVFFEVPETDLFDVVQEDRLSEKPLRLGDAATPLETRNRS